MSAVGATALSKKSPAPAIEFRHVSVAFDDEPALIDVSFQLRHGQMTILTGESGSGKSVLLRLAMGLLRPDAGEIFIDGREISSLDESELLAIRGGLMGIVFQEDSLFSGLSVYDNVAYRLTEHRWPEAETEKAVSEVLQFVGLEGSEQLLPEELSGGMKRRLEIARALVGWPSIMLFDEPTMSLDPIVALQILNLIIRARDINQISMIYVTKKPAEIPYLAEHMATNNNGLRICQTGPLDMPVTTVMVLKSGRLIFNGTHREFEVSNSPNVRTILALDLNDHSAGPYFTDPWDKSRQPREKLL
jgi:phospholipid/cholesterol/gamma-HCH transport system ATP-binding protein